MALPKLDLLNDFAITPRPGVDGSVKRYGHFDPENSEYVITRPDTPQPWYNYITNGSFGGYVSNTGGGTCFSADPLERRILRVHLHSRPADQPGRWIYIRDRKSGKFHSATWGPVFTPQKSYKYECRVGMGYTAVSALCDKIRSRVTYFVPADANAELWRLELTNYDKVTRQLDIFPYAEFLYFSLGRDNNLDAAFKCTDVAVKDRVIIHRSYYDWGNDRGGWKRQFAYFAASQSPASFDTNIDAFVGCYHGYDKPLAVQAGKCSNFNNRTGEPIAAMQFAITLKPGQSTELVFAVGYADDDASALREGKRAANVSFAATQLAKTRKYWQDYVGKFQATTPEPTFDVPFNAWSPYQSAITFQMSRAIAPYLLMGNRGLGYRDSNQDALGAMPYQDAAASRKLICTLLSVQRVAGDASHDFFPNLGTGLGSGYWDDHLWAALSIEYYLKESGDLAFMDKKLPFVDSKQKVSVTDHLERALKFTEKHVGKHGLPLLGFADWNDSLNAFPGAESLFTAGLYCAALKSMQSIYLARGETSAAASCAKRHAAMAKLINKYGWDGKWYTRLLTAEGEAIGSAKCKYGKIFMESNLWIVLGQAATPKRAVQAMDSLRKHLGTSYGHRLCAPPYPEYDPAVGTCTIFAPGIKENGAVFCHTNPWLVVAEAMLGRGHRAFDVFRRVSPYTKDQIQSIHCAEPYALNSLVTMPPNLEAGRGRNPWLTGFASWMVASMQRGILGVRPDFDGLVIDPCVPGWKDFRISRTFRGVEFDIHVRNPKGVEKGVKEISVDGQIVKGNVIPLPKGKEKKVSVEVLMG